jgi:hypothetical protein
VNRFYDKIAAPDHRGCCIWIAGRSTSGYGQFRLDRRLEAAHRLAWQWAHGPIPAGMKVLHRCDIPACVNVEHLFLGTDQDNARDRAAKGRNRDQTGENNNLAKLDRTAVLDIRTSSLGAPALAKKYGVTREAIYAVRARKTWHG